MIIKAALLLFRETNGRRELLFVRAHGKTHLLFPGGKQEPGETIEQALDRELVEELASTISNVTKLGVVEGLTPDGRNLTMHLYTGKLSNEPKASSEIAEIIWLTKRDIADHKDVMTPMTFDHVLPLVETLKLWD